MQSRSHSLNTLSLFKHRSKPEVNWDKCKLASSWSNIIKLASHRTIQQTRLEETSEHHPLQLPPQSRANCKERPTFLDLFKPWVPTRLGSPKFAKATTFRLCPSFTWRTFFWVSDRNFPCYMPLVSSLPSCRCASGSAFSIPPLWKSEGSSEDSPALALTLQAKPLGSLSDCLSHQSSHITASFFSFVSC